MIIAVVAMTSFTSGRLYILLMTIVVMGEAHYIASTVARDHCGHRAREGAFGIGQTLCLHHDDCSEGNADYGLDGFGVMMVVMGLRSASQRFHDDDCGDAIWIVVVRQCDDGDQRSRTVSQRHHDDCGQNLMRLYGHLCNRGDSTRSACRVIMMIVVKTLRQLAGSS